LKQAPFSGHVFVFRGKRGDLIKLLWFDGDGLCNPWLRNDLGRRSAYRSTTARQPKPIVVSVFV
jgi:transposase